MRPYLVGPEALHGAREGLEDVVARQGRDEEARVAEARDDLSSFFPVFSALFSGAVDPVRGGWSIEGRVTIATGVPISNEYRNFFLGARLVACNINKIH